MRDSGNDSTKSKLLMDVKTLRSSNAPEIIKFFGVDYLEGEICIFMGLFLSVCLSVCLCVCVFVCLSVSLCVPVFLCLMSTELMRTSFDKVRHCRSSILTSRLLML